MVRKRETEIILLLRLSRCIQPISNFEYTAHLWNDVIIVLPQKFKEQRLRK